MLGKKSIMLIILVSFLFIKCGKKPENSSKKNEEKKMSDIKSEPQKDEEDIIKIGAIYAKTGQAAVDNENSIYGVILAVEDLNKNGGVLGRNFKLKIYDNRSSSLGAKLAAQEAVKDNVIAVIGNAYSSHSLASAPVLQNAKIPMISNISTNPKVTEIGSYIFRVCFIDSFQGKVAANFAKQELKVKKASIVIDSDSYYSIELANFFKKKFEELSGEIMGIHYYKEETKNFSSILEEIKAENPELIFIPGYNKEVGLFHKQAATMDIKAKFLSGDGVDDSVFSYSGDSSEGAFVISHWTEEIQSKKNIEFVKKFEEKFGKDTPIGGAPLSYDAMNILADAIERAGSLDREKIRDEISKTNDFNGVSGTISFNSNGDPIKSAVIQILENNKLKLYKVIEP